MTDSTHECPKVGCSRRVPFHMLACRNHWYQVSKPTRDWVWDAYNSGGTDHAEAMAKAIDEMNAKL